jgi:hypothetical protein
MRLLCYLTSAYKFSGVLEESMKSINLLTPLSRIFADTLKDIGLSGEVLVDNRNSEMGFYLTQYNFIVLFGFLSALKIRRVSYSGVSGHNILSIETSHIDAEKSKYIWKKGADAIVYICRSLCENMTKVGLYQLEVQRTDVRILLKSISMKCVGMCILGSLNQGGTKQSVYEQRNGNSG